MLERRAFDGNLRRLRRAVFRDDYLARAGREFRREAGDQPLKRVGAGMRRNNDGRLQPKDCVAPAALAQAVRANFPIPS